MQFPSTTLRLSSHYGFSETIARLKSTLAGHGLTLFADLDQQAIASQASIRLRPTHFLLFGNPAVGTPIMQTNPLAAVELPLKLVVWEDEAQHVQIAYQDAAQVLTAQYGTDASLTTTLAQVPMLLQNALIAS